jgi:hypothetical protein
MLCRVELLLQLGLDEADRPQRLYTKGRSGHSEAMIRMSDGASRLIRSDVKREVLIMRVASCT